MDLPCPRCGEPWDFDTLHEEAELRGTSYAEVAAEFRVHGCVALKEVRGTDKPCSPAGERASTTALMASAAYDLLGDDMDGAAAMLEDWEMGC